MVYFGLVTGRGIGMECLGVCMFAWPATQHRYLTIGEVAESISLLAAHSSLFCGVSNTYNTQGGVTSSCRFTSTLLRELI
jgi:hypothetical protein